MLTALPVTNFKNLHTQTHIPHSSNESFDELLPFWSEFYMTLRAQNLADMLCSEYVDKILSEQYLYLIGYYLKLA